MSNTSPSLQLVSKTGTKQSEDVIHDTVVTLEGLEMNAALSLVSELSENIDYNYFQLGGVLSTIQSKGWYHEAGYDSFKEFVAKEYGLGPRKALYLVSIYNGLVDSGVAWNKVKHLGWTKLKELANVITPDNVDHWVGVAENSTVLQLLEAIKGANTAGDSGSSSDDAEGQPTSNVTTMTFKVHTDQKETVRQALDKAKEEAGTDVDTVALEMICMSFLQGGKVTKQVTGLKDAMAGASWEEVLSVFEQLWPDVDVEVTVK